MKPAIELTLKRIPVVSSAPAGAPPVIGGESK
jgi:hypothetical protein